MRFVKSSAMTITLVLSALASPSMARADPVGVAIRVEADRSRTLIHDALVNAPIAQIWEAISTPKGWMTWAVPVAWTSAADPDVLITSYDNTAKPGGPTTIEQRFVARIPGRLLVFRTIKAPAGFPHWETYRGVTSVFELETVGRQTRVRLTSLGYPDNDAGRALVGFFEKGNAETLVNLQRRFLSGPIDWKKR